MLPPQAVSCIARIKALSRTFHFQQLSLLRHSHILHWSFEHAFSLHLAKTVRAYTAVHLYYTVYTAFVHTHRESGISRRLLLCEARSSVKDPGVQNKDLSSAVILSLQTRGFCMGLAEPGLRSFIYFICYQGLGKHNAPLVRRSTMRRKPLRDGFHFSDPVPALIYDIIWSDTLLVLHNSAVSRTDVIPAHCRLLAYRSLLCLERGRTLKCTPRAI